MVWIGLILLVLAGTVFYIVWSTKRGSKDRRGLFQNFAITLSGTFIGIFLATQLSEAVASASQKADYVALVSNTQKELLDIRTRTDLFRTGLLSPDDPATRRLIDENPIEEPLLLDSLIQSDAFAKFAAVTASGILLERRNLEFMDAGIADTTRSAGDRVLLVGLYVQELDHLAGILAVSIDYTNGAASDAEAADRLQTLTRNKVWGGAPAP